MNLGSNSTLYMNYSTDGLNYLLFRFPDYGEALEEPLKMLGGDQKY